MITTEDEQLATLRSWWQRNGNPILIGTALALVAVFGWRYYQNWQENQAQTASVIYQQLLEVSLGAPPGQVDLGKVSELAAELKEGHKGSAYEGYGRLLVAKVAVDAGRLDDAAAELQAIVDKPHSSEFGELARQRLARVLSAQGKTEEALALLKGEAKPAAFRASREEIKGDLLVKLGRRDEARVAYESAKAAVSEEAALGLLQMKLDDLTQNTTETDEKGAQNDA